LRALKVTYDRKKSQITGKTAGCLALYTAVILVVVVAFMLSAIPAAEATHYRGMRHFPSANLSMTKGSI
jgi:hypothetical protein